MVGPIQRAFKKLGDLVKEIDTPLSILDFQCVHPAARNCDPFPPQPLADLNSIDRNDPANAIVSMDVTLQFETSRAWPDDLAAISRIKTAFYLKLAQQLRTEHDTPAAVGIDFIDIVVDGFAFRLRIFHDRQLLIHKADAIEVNKSKFIAQAQRKGRALDANELKEAEKNANTEVGIELERSFVHRPVFASSIKGLNQRFPVFNPTVHLVKRWLASHMLSESLSTEAVELLVAYVFCCPMPYVAPSSAPCGLLRFLQLLSSRNFKEAPLIVDLYGDMKLGVFNAITEKFKAVRADGKGSAIFIATEKQPNSVWTAGTDPDALADVVSTATLSMAHMKSLIESSLTSPYSASLNEVLWKSLFKASLQSYDLLIAVDPYLLPTYRQALSFLRFPPSQRSPPSTVTKKMKKFKLPPGAVASDSLAKRPLPMIGFDPLDELLSDLREQFGRYCELFADRYGSPIIGVKWKKLPFGPSKFSVSHAAYTAPSKTGDASTASTGEKKKKKKGKQAAVIAAGAVITRVEPDVGSIASHIKVAGKGLIIGVYNNYEEFRKASAK